MNNKEKAFRWSIVGFFTVCAVGTLDHFLYKLTGSNSFVGIFAPVNESIWEHLKLLFFPFVIYIVVEYFVYGKHIKGFLFSRVTGAVIGMIFIPAAFYIYTSIAGRNYAPADIAIYIVSVIAAFAISFYRILMDKDNAPGRNIAAIILILCITALFAGLTFSPPDTALFKEPN